MTEHLSELELDALRELANIGSGNAATALSHLVSRSIDVSVPSAHALALPAAIQSAGPAESVATVVVLPVRGGIDAVVLLLFSAGDARALCSLLEVEPESDVGRSALGEIGNILGSSYIGALGAMTGLELEPAPPSVSTERLGAIIDIVVAAGAGENDVALALDSDLVVEGTRCSFSFVLVPTAAGVSELLSRLGIEGGAG